jgi:alpha-glucosidase
MKNIWQLTVHSASTRDFVSPLPIIFGQPLTIRLRVAEGSPVSRVFLRCAPEGSGRFWELKKERTSDGFDYFALTFELRWNIFDYRFLILCEDGANYWYNAKGLQSAIPVDHGDFKLRANHQVSDWPLSSVFYQIFPDRFANGDPDTNYVDGEKAVTGEAITVKAWGEQPEGGFDFFNGDLKGIENNIAHLQELGVNALYLNPVGTAPSNHKYDVIDYFHVDKHLGGDEAFIRLVDTLHDNDIKIVIDGIFNHCGWAHEWFNRFDHFEGKGAYNDTSSPYYDFFTFKEHPNNYTGWWGFDSLPKLDYRSDKLRDAIYRDDNSVMKYWLKPPFNLDGWRFDVANMQARFEDYQAGLEVWQEVREALKPLGQEKYLMGEHFYDGSDLLQGDALDGIMNYMGFYYPIYHWLSGRYDFIGDGEGNEVPYANYDAETFKQQLQDFIGNIPWQNALAMYNMISSHDRPRMLTLLGGDKDKLITALVFLFSYVGVPAVYYGDEVGMEGGKDPDCRRTMIWDREQWDMPIWQAHQKLIEARLSAKSLQQGSLIWCGSEAPEVVAFGRELDGEVYLSVLAKEKNGQLVAIDTSALNLQGKGTWIGVLSGASYPVNSELPQTSDLYRLA